MIVVEIKGETEETSGLSGETVRSSGITEACTPVLNGAFTPLIQGWAMESSRKGGGWILSPEEACHSAPKVHIPLLAL